LEPGVPLYRTAIVYRQDEPYAALVRAALEAAGLPWVSSEGRRLAESRPGRCLLGLFRLFERDFTREAVLEWLETGPIPEDPSVPLAAPTWDRLSRRTGVVRGADQWRERLEAFAARAGGEVPSVDGDDGDSPPRASERRLAGAA